MSFRNAWLLGITNIFFLLLLLLILLLCGITSILSTKRIAKESLRKMLTSKVIKVTIEGE